MAETPDFGQIADGIAAHWADGATGELAEEIAAALRQVWNARAVDVAHMIAPGEGSEDEKRLIDGREWQWGGTDDYTRWYAADEQRPAVMCACGRTWFEISYESYACRAHCECGRSFVIYDG